MAEPEARMLLDTALLVMERAVRMNPNREWRLTVQKFNPGGLTAHQTTEVAHVNAGFDWQAGQIVITPAKPLTELTPEQVEAIEKSVKLGQSWHAYQAHKKQADRIAELEAEVKRLREAAGGGEG